MERWCPTVAQVHPHERAQDLAAAVHLGPEGLLGAVQLGRHAGVLRPLAREEEGHRLLARLRRVELDGSVEGSALKLMAGGRAVKAAQQLEARLGEAAGEERDGLGAEGAGEQDARGAIGGAW